jgi:hypothetical protein
LRKIHFQEAANADARYNNIKATIFETVRGTNELQAQEHEVTRQEIAQQAVTDAAALRANMDKRTDEIKALIRKANQAKGRKEKIRLKEKTNAATASLIAMDLIYGSLMVRIRFLGG